MTLNINNIYEKLNESSRCNIEAKYIFVINNNNALNTAFDGINNTINILIKNIDKNIEIIDNKLYNFNDTDEYDEEFNINDKNIKVFVLQNKNWYIKLLSNIVIKIKKSNNRLYININLIKY